MRHCKKGDGDSITGGNMSEMRGSYGKFEVTFIGYLLYVSFRSQHSKCINSFNPYKSSMV